MKVNAKDYFVENKILTANEDEVVYDVPRQRIQEIWDKLSVLYTNKTLEENKENAIENEFYSDLSKARNENETLMSIQNLINQKVLKSFDCSEPKEARSNIKKFILNENLNILRKGIQELKDNIEDEERCYSHIEKINSELKILDGRIKIKTGKLECIDYEDFLKIVENKNKIGYSCTIQTNGVEFTGFHPCRNYPSVLTCKIFEGSHSYNGISVKIVKEYQENSNEICTAFLDELYSGRDVNEIIRIVPVMFSNYFLNKLTNGYSKKIIETSQEKKEDGLSATFYCVTERFTLKFERNERCKIYFNEKLLRIENRKKI